MIGTIPSKANLKLISDEAAKLDYHVDNGNVHMGNGQGRGIPSGIHNLPGIGGAISEICGLRRNLTPVNVMINILKSGAPVPKHRDFIPPTKLQPVKPCIERWHLAIETNDKCFWWDEVNKNTHFPVGFWSGPVPYWTEHTVINNGTADRLHIIVDLDTSEKIGEYIEDIG